MVHCTLYKLFCTKTGDIPLLTFCKYKFFQVETIYIFKYIFVPKIQLINMQLRLLIQTNEDLIYKGLFRILISTQTIFDLFGKKSCNINIITRKTIPCLKTQILFVLLSKKRLKCLAKLCIIPVYKHCLN